MKSTAIGIIVLILVVISLSSFGSTHAYYTSRKVTGPHLISTWQSNLWTRTTQADFQAGVPVNVNISTISGSVILENQTTTPSIYATTGSSTNFLVYIISNNTWAARANTPGNVGAGGGVRYIGLGNISALRGSNTNALWVYNISSNSWSVKAVTPSNVNTGGSLSDYIGSGNISALRGASTATFWMYNISTNAWSVKANAPGNVGAGGALAYDNGNYIYAFNGTNTRNFWRYSISGNSWSALANIPGNVGDGGSLASDKVNYIYAFNGTTTAYFWRYDIINNSWSDAAVADPPVNVGAGGSLTYIAGSSGYKNAGTIASPVFDTGYTGKRWDSLQWDSAIIAGTNITFEVRSSDTLFAMDDSTPLWTIAGWPSPVSSGLPSGRYLQWRASLSTNDPSKTPVLSEVRVWYS